MKIEYSPCWDCKYDVESPMCEVCESRVRALQIDALTQKNENYRTNDIILSKNEWEKFIEDINHPNAIVKQVRRKYWRQLDNLRISEQKDGSFIIELNKGD